METKHELPLTRRQFLGMGSALLGSSLILSCEPLEKVSSFLGFGKSEFSPNVYLMIGQDDVVQIICHRSEMGQGVRTSMPMLLAEELDADWSKIKVIQAVGDAKYGDQNTDGSTSVRINWESLRKAGAAARAMLIEAAASTWNVPKDQCSTRDGRVHHQDKVLSYGQLVSKAKDLSVPKEAVLKKHKDFKIIGTPQKFVDLHDITVGKAKYGIDSEVPEMVHAVLVRSPTTGGTVKSYDEKSATDIPGVIQVVKLKAIGPDVNTKESLAVVAKHTYAAIAGAKALEVEWDKATADLESTSTMKAAMDKALESKGEVVREQGDFSGAMNKATKTLEAKYFVPYLVHAPMEPPNAVAHVKGGECEIWAPTQQAQRARKAVASYLGIDEDAVTIHVTLLGGGFGRKSQPDFILEAVALSKKLGKPAKITWTRENDIQHSYYHAVSMQKLTAGLDKTGNLVAWQHKSSFPTIAKVFHPLAFSPLNFEVGQGMTTNPYRITNLQCVAAPVRSQLVVGWLRSVCHIFHSFAINSFIDEIAAASKKDPAQLRLDLIGAPQTLAITDDEKNGAFKQDTGRLSQVIKKAASMPIWKHRSSRQGRGVGFASHYSFYSYVAMAVEVSVRGNVVTIEGIDCVADCGTIVNPNTVRAQLEGGILYGLSLAALGEISVEAGQVTQSNFHNYPIVRMHQAPPINIEVIKNTEAPTGIGEPGTPPVAPALANALFAATGKRLRELPLVKHGFEFS